MDNENANCIGCGNPEELCICHELDYYNGQVDHVNSVTHSDDYDCDPKEPCGEEDIAEDDYCDDDYHNYVWRKALFG